MSLPQVSPEQPKNFVFVQSKGSEKTVVFHGYPVKAYSGFSGWWGSLFGRTIKLQVDGENAIMTGGKSVYLDARGLINCGVQVEKSAPSGVLGKLFRVIFPNSGYVVEKSAVEAYFEKFSLNKRILKAYVGNLLDALEARVDAGEARQVAEAFRVPADKGDIDEFLKNIPAVFDDIPSNVIIGATKQILKEFDICYGQDPVYRDGEVPGVSPLERELLEKVVGLLAKIAGQQERMDSNSLSICLAPSLFDKAMERFQETVKDPNKMFELNKKQIDLLRSYIDRGSIE